MKKERRRYFRINQTTGISYQLVGNADETDEIDHTPNVLELVSEQDQQIEKLLLEVAEENPKVAELVSVFNLKLERIVSQLVLESSLVDRIAYKVREANISACGIAFVNDEFAEVGARVLLELTLYPGEQKINTYGRLVGCSPADEPGEYFWRIDFYGMTHPAQEQLIQHIVRSQSAQLQTLRDPK